MEALPTFNKTKYLFSPLTFPFVPYKLIITNRKVNTCSNAKQKAFVST